MGKIQVNFWLFVLAFSLIFAGYSLFSYSRSSSEYIESIQPYVILNSSASSNKKPLPKILQEDYTKASCQLSGSISFINKSLYRTEGAKISYQNIDDITRQIIWTVYPDDGALRVGPNLFEQLKIPNGEREVGVALYDDPTVNSYTLTAAVTYGVDQPDGSEKIEEVKCTGEVIVNIPEELFKNKK